MSNEVSEDSTVSFSVKELLTEQTGLLREIDRKVDGKADKADLVPLIAKLEDHGTRLKTIEDERKSERAVSDDRKGRRRTLWLVFTAVMVPFGSTLLFIFH